MLQPETGRIRASHEGYIYHHSRGPNDKGYEICLECGRAGDAGTDALKDHRPLTPRDRKAIDRCPGNRSEEHTSELQSLMRISYAVFCLKKKKNKKQTAQNE